MDLPFHGLAADLAAPLVARVGYGDSSTLSVVADCRTAWRAVDRVRASRSRYQLTAYKTGLLLRRSSHGHR